MQTNNFYTTVIQFFKWMTIYILIGVIVGSVTAFFLHLLDDVTLFRMDHIWIVNFLPVAGLGIGLLYYYYGNAANKGNNLLLETHQSLEKGETKNVVPLKIAPLVFLAHF